MAFRGTQVIAKTGPCWHPRSLSRTSPNAYRTPNVANEGPCAFQPLQRAVALLIGASAQVSACRALLISQPHHFASDPTEASLSYLADFVIQQARFFFHQRARICSVFAVMISPTTIPALDVYCFRLSLSDII